MCVDFKKNTLEKKLRLLIAGSKVLKTTNHNIFPYIKGWKKPCISLYLHPLSIILILLIEKIDFDTYTN